MQMHPDTVCDDAQMVYSPEVNLILLPPLSVSHHTGPALLKAEQEPAQSSEF